MNENAKKWVAALRSGEYRQGRGCLMSAEGYCCLGVACDVYEKETGRSLPRNIGGFFTRAVLEGDFRVVRDWLELNSYDGTHSGRGRSSLADANDTGATFLEIADIIESEPEGLFS